MSDARGQYPAKRRVTIVEVADLRVRELTLAPGQCVPWHFHTEVTERFFCMEGPMQVLTRDPDGAHVLGPGQVCTVDPGVAHRVGGVEDGACRFMSVQGVGKYDFMRVDD